MRARAATIVCTWWVVRWAAGLASGAAVHCSGAWAVQAASSASCTARLRLWGAEGSIQGWGPGRLMQEKMQHSWQRPKAQQGTAPQCSTVG